MRMWQVLFTDCLSWEHSILVAAPYPAFCLQDAVDEAADSDEGQKYKITDERMAEYHAGDPEILEDEVTYFGNASDPFGRYELHAREVTPEQVLESGAELKPCNMDAETLVRELIAEKKDPVLSAAWEILERKLP